MPTEQRGGGARRRSSDMSARPEQRLIDGVKSRLLQLRSRNAEVRKAEESLAAEREQLEREIAEAESELSNAVNAPAFGGEDPTLWLPDELMIQVLLALPHDHLWARTSACACVCRRWRALVQSPPVQAVLRNRRWEAYANNWISPKVFGGPGGGVLAVGSEGTLYSGCRGGSIAAWPQGRPGAERRRIRGHKLVVSALAVGPDNKLYSGSHDRTIQVWDGVDGTHIRSLLGHTDWVVALAVGATGQVYSGSHDGTIRVWSDSEGTHLQTLESSGVVALAVGSDGKLYSSSFETTTVEVWSGGVDVTHLTTLEGHTGAVNALAASPNGHVFSASADRTVRVWSGETGALLTTLTGHANEVQAVVCGADGRIYTGAWDDSIRVWTLRKEAEPEEHILKGVNKVEALALSPSGKLYSASMSGTISLW